MNSLIEIKVNNNTDREVTFPKLLTVLESFGEKYHWSILYLDATGDLGPGISLSDFENKIKESENGLVLNWKELKNISRKLFQVIEMSLVASEDANLIKKYETDRDLFNHYPIVIDILDGDLWRVWSKERKVIEMVTLAFKDAHQGKIV